MRYFNEKMTSAEARTILFSSVDTMSRSEVEEVKREYAKIAPAIAKREMKENRGWMTEDSI